MVWESCGHFAPSFKVKSLLASIHICIGSPMCRSSFDFGNLQQYLKYNELLEVLSL